MIINNTKYRLPKNKYFQEETPKDLIVLHFTAGSTASGAFASWMQQAIRIGTPYVVDIDGTVYELFDPKCWAFHLAVVGTKAQNHKHDKRSVPMEIVNFGGLKLVGDYLCSWPNNYKQKFCKVSETDKYIKSTYRGFEYFAAFPQVQHKAVVELVNHISTTFNIPIVLPPLDKRVVYDMNFYDTWKGVASHQNFRSDKSDIGPAWDWLFV
jgi:N-acetylmuramoyl-L-alanine amidase.